MSFSRLRQDVLQGRPSEVRRLLYGIPANWNADVLLHPDQSPSSEPSVCSCTHALARNQSMEVANVIRRARVSLCAQWDLR